MFQNKEKISGNQALALVLAGGIGTIFEVVATFAIKDAGRDGWLSVLIAYGLAAIVGFILLNLGKRFPNKTFVQYLPLVLGKIPGKIAGLAYILGWWIMTPVIIRSDIELIRFFLPTTPLLILIILMVLLVMYVMGKGFEVFARTAELFVILVIFSIILILGLNTFNVNFKNLTPILANGFAPVLKSLIVQFAFAIETILFMALWLPCLNKHKGGARAVVWGISISGVLLTVLVAAFVGFTGTSLTPRMLFPIFYMSRYIQIGGFLTGLEAIFMLLWLISSYLEILVFSYPSVVGLAQWLNLKDYKPLILPMTVITIVLSILPTNMLEVSKLDALKNPTIIIPLALLIPLTWLIAIIRNLKEKESI
ncbi:MAG TPA: endospore germination permease [Bacillota bacterium]|nr:endospore germination permease [Bacillota bacterium]